MIDKYFIKFPYCKNQANNGTFTLKPELLTKIDRLSASKVSENDLYNLYVMFIELFFWCSYKLQDGKTIEGDTNAQLTNTLSDKQKNILKQIQAMYLN